MKRIILALPMLALLAACGEPAVPSRAYYPTDTATPMLIVKDMQADANLQSAQSTSTALAVEKAQATEEARQTKQAGNDAATATMQAVRLGGTATQGALIPQMTGTTAANIAGQTQVALGLTQQAATPTALAMSIELSRTASLATQQARDNQTQREKRETDAANSAAFWGLVDGAIRTIIIASCAVLVVALIVAGGVFVGYAIIYAKTRLEIERTRLHKEGIVSDVRGAMWYYDKKKEKFYKLVEDQPLLAEPEPAPAEGISYKSMGKVQPPLPRGPKGDEGKVALVLALLADTLAYLGDNPKAEAGKLPGWRELNKIDPPGSPPRWSGSRWTRAVDPLRRYLSPTGDGLFLAKDSRYKTWAELYGFIDRKKSLV